MDEKQWIGMGLAIMGALFWGLSGTSVQFLENAKHLNVEWLLEVRLLVAGLLTILLSYIQDGIRIFDIFKKTPPIRAGKKIVHKIMTDSYEHLNAQGELWVVIQKKQGMASCKKLLEDTFSMVEIVTKNKGYYILKAVK